MLPQAPVPLFHTFVVNTPVKGGRISFLPFQSDSKREQLMLTGKLVSTDVVVP